MILRSKPQPSGSTEHHPPRLAVRGGAGQGITTTGIPITSYGTRPPAATVTKDRGLKGPQVAGSSGGFIGLITGIAILVIAGVFLGIYLYNRHRRRLPSKRSIVDNLPSLSFSRPPNDPYAEPIPGLDTDQQNPHPGASRFGFGRPIYTRQRSSEWELPLEHRPGGGKGKGKARDWGEVEMPSEPDEAAFPLRSRSPRPVSPRVRSDGRSGRGNGSTQSLSPRVTPTLGQAGTNPFEPELEEAGHIGGHAEESNKLMPGERYLRRVGSDDDTVGDHSTITSGSTEELESSVEVEGIREGTRFVERFGSREG